MPNKLHFLPFLRTSALEEPDLGSFSAAFQSASKSASQDWGMKAGSRSGLNRELLSSSGERGMTQVTQMESKASPFLRAKHVYLLAAVSLVAILAIEYLPPGTQLPDSLSRPSTASGPLSSPDGKMRDRLVLTPEELKQIADRQAAPLVERLRSDPNNMALLAQVGAIYYIARQYPQAGTYYGEAVKLDPGNVALRTKLAASLFRSGDADAAIAELNRALSYGANDANALFDLGVIRFEGKRDRKGALAAWKRLLEANPQLSAERKATVEKLMAEASVTPVDRGKIDRSRTHDSQGSVSQ